MIIGDCGGSDFYRTTAKSKSHYESTKSSMIFAMTYCLASLRVDNVSLRFLYAPMPHWQLFIYLQWTHQTKHIINQNIDSTPLLDDYLLLSIGRSKKSTMTPE